MKRRGQPLNELQEQTSGQNTGQGIRSNPEPDIRRKRRWEGIGKKEMAKDDADRKMNADGAEMVLSAGNLALDEFADNGNVVADGFEEAAPDEDTDEACPAGGQDFVSTGALRTDAHKNMRAVYAQKSKSYKMTKRFFDIILAGIALGVLSPLFLVTAIAIRSEDKGPAFFTQPRAGKDLQPFKMYKFRSMFVDADEKLKEMLAENEQTGHAFKIKNDPRVTKTGQFIRRTSIDELPQLINIIRGDMSIVGPRPILDWQMEECDEYDQQRLIVQPGLTCYWQIGGRSNITWDEWVELDLKYIEDMSLKTDLRMIVKTIPAVLKGDGAY